MPLKILFIGLNLIFTQSVLAQVKAENLVGNWSCQPEGNVPAFEWRVNRDLRGGWLVGEGYENKHILTSIDIWAINQDDTLSTRRQFTPNGGFIVMNPIKSKPQELESEGELTQRDGTIINLTHQVSFINNNNFKARWLVVEDSQVKEQISEICTRQDN